MYKSILIAALAALPGSVARAEAKVSCYAAVALRDEVNLRKAPKLTDKASAHAKQGATFAVASVPGEESWARITEGDRQGLFLHLSVFRIRFRSELSSCKEAEGAAELSGDRVNVRGAPSKDAPSAGQLFESDPLTVSPASGPWLKIVWPEEFKGKFIHSDFVKLRLPMASEDFGT